MASSNPGFPAQVAQVTGPLLTGYLLNYGLYGILCVQTYIYYTAFPNDKPGFQILVYAVLLLDTIQTVMITVDAFRCFVFGFGNLETIGRIGLFWFDLCFIDGIVACLVQLFFAYRIRRFSNSKVILPGIIAITAFAQLSGALASGIRARNLESLSQLRAETFIESTIWLAGSAICDVLIAFSMIYVLSKANSTYKETRDLIRRLIILTMETGALTALATTVDIIILLGFPKQTVHITFTLTLAKLYSNSLLVVLNTRLVIPGSRGFRGASAFVTSSHRGGGTSTSIDLSNLNSHDRSKRVHGNGSVPRTRDTGESRMGIDGAGDINSSKRTLSDAVA
ncbi:hypothetical protein PQX77_018046 [Marasmius sp. AFHP31]|nr:hypothetical protein PQX77_018046 [Marasmius sp. AFHP31]